MINNYSNHKNIHKPEDYDKLLYEKLEKYNIGLNELSYINIYIRLCYIYFNNYNRSKIIKQIKQVNTNLHNNNKTEILVYQ